ncbi:hypothetical protein FBU30_000387 [Linnemannia zychae]|nr:hypothetical protein FBU30_000387 [Linnemannia zychae]
MPYFDLVKPASVSNSAQVCTSVNMHNIPFDQDMDDNTLPGYLNSFQDTGISDARLRQFTWLHPKNYGYDGSLSDDFVFSPYGTSVSSPRGDEWEIVDNGPRKSIDELWNEVFEYKKRIKILERAYTQDCTVLPTHLDIHHDLNDEDASSKFLKNSNMSPFASTSGTGCYKFMTYIDRTAVYASQRGARSGHGAAARSLMHIAIGNVIPSLDQ